MSTPAIIIINAVFWSFVLVAIVSGLLKAIRLDRRAHEGASVPQPATAGRERRHPQHRPAPRPAYGGRRVAAATGTRR